MNLRQRQGNQTATETSLEASGFEGCSRPASPSLGPLYTADVLSMCCRHATHVDTSPISM